MSSDLTPAASGGALRADRLVAVRSCLQGALATDSGLDDAERIDSIRALEELICTATAAQAALSRELDVSQRSAQAAAGTPAAQQGRGIAQQIALARRESPTRGQQHLGLAKIAPAELPHTWAAWTAGRVTEWAVTLIARETACLSVEGRLAVDETLAADPATFEQLGIKELGDKLRALAAELDPAAVVKRRRRAEADRHVTLRPAPDTMCWLTALLPVKEGVAAYATLTRAADTARADGDTRSKGQVMADTLVAATLSGPGTSTPTVELSLVMDDASLLGDADTPAHLQGWGPIPAELAREIITDHLATAERTWLRRLYTCPSTGELIAMDSRRRLFPRSMARFIRLRDQHCRTPWCGAPIRHIDHAMEHDRGGPTTIDNGQGLCEACNHAKQADGWRTRPRPGPGHPIETRTPTGHTYVTRPPARATITRRDLPEIVLDYYLPAS